MVDSFRKLGYFYETTRMQKILPSLYFVSETQYWATFKTTNVDTHTWSSTNVDTNI